MTRPKIFLDLDGVIVDMQRPFMKFWGAAIPCESQYPEGYLWNIQGAIELIRKERGLKPLALTGAKFWGSVPEDWWVALEPYKAASMFIKFLEQLGDVVFATASMSPQHAAAKFKWIARCYPEYSSKTFVGDPKYMLAAPNAILIDDRDLNCEQFIERGGKAVLFPRPWNKRGWNPAPFTTVRNQMERLVRKATWT